MEVTNVLIPWYPISYLTIASSGFLGGGRLRVPTRRCDLVVPADLLAALEGLAHVIPSVAAVLDVAQLCPCHFVDHHASEDSIAIVDAVTSIVGEATVIVGVIVATIVVVVAEVVMMKIVTTDNDGPPKRMLNFHN